MQQISLNEFIDVTVFDIDVIRNIRLTLARLETINEKISFKKLIQLKRCVAVADGFYEWKREGKQKTPFYFLREDKKMIFIAGIFEDNQFCLITEQAAENINQVHHRQPVILNEKDINNYLNLQSDGSNFLKEARLRGNKTMNGQMMFLEQAKESFRIWTDITPEIDKEMIKLLNND